MDNQSYSYRFTDEGIQLMIIDLWVLGKWVEDDFACDKYREECETGKDVEDR